MCDKMNKEIGKCFELGCRYHMVAEHFRKGDSDDTILWGILDAQHTCLWEIVDSGKCPLTYEEIGVILKISRQGAEQLENRALKKLAKKKRMKDLEIYNEPEHDPFAGYVLFPDTRKARISEWSYLAGACTWKGLSNGGNNTETPRDLCDAGEAAEGGDSDSEEGCPSGLDFDSEV